MALRSFLFLLISLISVIISLKVKIHEVVPMQRVKQSHHRADLTKRDFGGFDYILIPKTMSTMAKLVFCDLVRRQRKLPRIPVEVGSENICVTHKWYKYVQPKGGFTWRQPKRSKRSTLLILRDPFERFVSMYAYLCKQRKFCHSTMDIHGFAKRVYYSLRNRKLADGFSKKDRKEVFRHLQPSFWFAYSRDIQLPKNPELMYLTLDRRMNAIKLRDIFIKRANVPPTVAGQVVEPVRTTYGNTLRTEEGKRDHVFLAHLEAQVYKQRSTFLYVLKSYYNDYKLLKLELPKPLIRSLVIYNIELPNKIRRLPRGGKVLSDRCSGPKHLAEKGKKIPLNPC